MPVKLSSLLVFFLFLALGLQAQLVCNFLADTTQGCAPQQINFTDLSSGPRSVIWWHWDFGNSATSNLQNPSRTFPTSGRYTVTLTVFDGVDTARLTKTNYIHIFKSPQSDFTFTQTALCKPSKVTFNQRVTLGDAPIQSYSWDFGDLSPLGSGANTSHTYVVGGVFSAILGVTDTNGCKSSSPVKKITVQSPKAAFTASNRSDCLPPLTVNFNNISTGSGPLTYLWDLGNSNTSTTKNPSQTYTSNGAYDIRLIVTDNAGCKDTLLRKRYVSIGNTKADFSYPDTVCVNVANKFTNLSVGANNYVWTFTPGGTSASFEPLMSFSSGGIVQVKLVARSGSSCVDSIKKNIYVEDVKANFDFHYDSICSPNLVRFENKTQGAVSGHYDINLGSSMNRVKLKPLDTTFRFPRSPCRKTFYPVTMHITTKNNCKAQVTKQVMIENDEITGIVNSSSTCTPANFTFSAQECMRFKVVKWFWDFNTGNPADTANVQNPSKVITKTVGGRYIAKLTATDSNGCKFSKNVPYEVGEKQKADFSISDDSLCYEDLVWFTNLSTDSNKITQYSWRFGDLVTSNVRHPQHQYRTLGSKTVTLYIWNYTCMDSISKNLYVSGPVGSITGIPNCANKLNQQFKGQLHGGYSWFYWDFGDTSALDSSNLNPTHNYSKAGKYIVKLVAKNDTTQCVDTAKFEIDPNPVKANLSMTSNLLCKGGTMWFNGAGSKGDIGQRYFWDFGNGNKDQFVSRTYHRFMNSGKYNIQLVVMSADSCTDTASQVLNVVGPNTAHDLPAVLCKGDNINVMNTSQPDTTVVEYSWRLNFKEVSKDTNFRGFIGVDSSKYDSTLIMNSDTHRLTLFMRDTAGCVDSVAKVVHIHELEAKFEVTDTAMCIGDTVTLYDTRLPSNVNHLWDKGDGTLTIDREPMYSYGKRGNFEVKYIVMGGGCSDTATRMLQVQGIDSMKFVASLTDTNCYPATIYFDDFSVGDSIRFITWDFGDGVEPVKSSRRDSLTKTFKKPGIFSVKAVVETSFGCKDSITYQNYIRVRGPYAEFAAFPDSVCIHEPITLVKDTASPTIKGLVWDFADGRVDSTGRNIDSLTHSYNTAGNRTVILLYEDSMGTCASFFSKEIVVEDVHANFTFNPDSAGCEPWQAAFIDQGIDGNTWQWSFGDGNTSIRANPNNLFQKAGIYDVKLLYSNSRNGCKDSVVKSVEVWPNPVVVAVPDTHICHGDTAQLSASGALDYNWTQPQHLSSANVYNPLAFPPLSETFEVRGRDGNRCEGTDEVFVFVQQEPIIQMDPGGEIIVGEDYSLNPSITHGKTYRWEPSASLSCSDCPNPIAKPAKSTEYTLFVTDSLGCFEVSQKVNLEVDIKFSVDMPDGFTPNGDGINDLIMPNGWGIKSVLVYKVFNRWGELIFEATPQQPAWDGYYKGKLQNVETYVYYVKVESYEGEVLTKEGFFSLLR
jgi:gliding motility-associated-like protein